MTILDQSIVAPDRSSTAPLFCDDLRLHGDRVALIADGHTITYAELEERVDAVAARLGSERRLILLGAGNAIEPLVAYLAALRGGHPVLLAAADNDDTAGLLASAYDPDVVIAAHDGWAIEERRAESAHELHPDLALLLSTSGSTGSAKLVRLSRQNLRANAESIAEYLGITEHHRAVTTLPMQYCYGLSVINSHLQSGAALVLTDLSVVDRCFWDLFAATKATSFAGVPHTFDLLDRAGFASMSLPTLRHVTQAGGRLQPDKVRRYAALGQRRGWDFFVMYGQTEATARMAYLPPALASSHPGAIGIAIPGGKFAIEAPDDDGIGELVYRGENVMLGYAEHPDDLALGATVEALHTGDLARVDAEGVYELTGRRSRFIKLFGLRIDLDRVERLVTQHGAAALCTGNDEHVIVAVESGVDTTTMARFISDQLGLPCSRVVVVELDVLPRLSNGKPDYLSVQRHAAHVGGTPLDALPCGPDPRSSDHRTAVLAAFAKVLGTDASDQDSFVSLGGDSLSYVEMSVQLEEILGFLPRDWHTTPIGELVPARSQRRFFRQTETSVALRAAAILLVVVTHAGLWHLPGGAHALLGIAGYNFARFQLRATAKVSSIAKIALPAMCWIGVVAATTDSLSWPNVLLVGGQFGAPDGAQGYWFIEAIVLILVPLALVFGINKVRHLERRWPYGFAVAAVTAGLGLRFGLADSAITGNGISRPHEVFWLFALGWAAARATTPVRRLVVSLLVIASVYGFFGDTSREAIVVVGLLLIAWRPTLGVPWPVNRLCCALAGASLYIYLTHWQVYPPLLRHYGPAMAVIGSVLVGVATWFMARRIIAAAERVLVRATPAGTRRGCCAPPAPPRSTSRWRVRTASERERHYADLAR